MVSSLGFASLSFEVLDFEAERPGSGLKGQRSRLGDESCEVGVQGSWEYKC